MIFFQAKTGVEMWSKVAISKFMLDSFERPREPKPNASQTAEPQGTESL
jgi:hypothetical protein